jgi:4-hydroxy-tetrahydrodipicolinate reductase
MSLKILLNGAKGRMGQTIAGLAGEMDATISAAIDVGDDPAQHLAGCDVVIDFSGHSATGQLLELVTAQKKPIVIGTTGHGADEKKHLLAQAAKVPCVWAGNFSVGVNLLFALTRRASAVLGSDYDTEVIEMHHRFKKDAPSGTAARLLEIILEERKLTANALKHGRSGITGERQSTEVSLRCARRTPRADA